MSGHGHHHATVDPTFSAKARSTWEIVRRVGIYLRPYPGMAVATVLCAVLSLAASFAFPKLTQVIIDEVITQRRLELLTPAMLGVLAAFLLRDFFNGVRIRINNTLEQNVIFDIRRAVYSRLQELPVGYFDQRASGDLMTRVIEDVNTMERILIDGTEQGTVAILSIVGVLGFLFFMNPMLAGIALIPVPLLFGGALWYTLTAHRRYRTQRKAASAMNALLMDNLQGIRQIKAYGRQPHENARFAERADDMRQGTLEVMRVWSFYSPAMSFATGLGNLLVLWFGGRLVIQGAMSIGELVGFLFFLNLFYDPVGRLHSLNQMLQGARAAGERVFDILDFQTETANPKRKRKLPSPVRGEVVYENVSFQYTSDRAVLSDVSLQAEPGQVVALVGPTGAGKTTLVNLLPAFYELSAGRVLVDGCDISELALDSLRSQISIVSQEAFLFNGTVGENIRYGALDATEAAVIAAAKAANCHEFISRLPQTYDTRVGERGVKLSVGEKQRVSIARALLKNAPILILDEATASVDTATERLIQEALERLMAHRTSFVIAHRLSTVRKADQILVLKGGRIVERGTHSELLLANGLYSRLAEIQNTTFIEESFEKLATS